MRGPQGGKRSLKVAGTEYECRDEKEVEEEGVQLSPIHAPRPQTLENKEKKFK